MHRTGTRDRFGWDRSNTIGATPQMNPWTEDWAEFFAEHRIGFQLRLAARKGMRFTGADELVETIPQLLAGHTPIASIVHGDLWGGNASVTAEGEPVIFDPPHLLRRSRGRHRHDRTIWRFPRCLLPGIQPGMAPR